MYANVSREDLALPFPAFSYHSTEFSAFTLLLFAASSDSISRAFSEACKLLQKEDFRNLPGINGLRTLHKNCRVALSFPIWEDAIHFFPCLAVYNPQLQKWGGIMKRARKTESIVLAAVLLAGLSIGLASGARAQTPLRIEDAMSVLALAGRTPISLSPDGSWVAFTVQDERKHDSTNDKRYMFYLPSGAFTEALGCDIWISNTKTGESKNLTLGKGTSWAPVWSPDGKSLAFYSDRNGTAHVWIWEKASGQIRELPNGIVKPFFNFQTVRWSPDGRKILVKVLPEGMTVEQAADLTTGPVEKKEEKKRPREASP
jgi:hypothetical protein